MNRLFTSESVTEGHPDKVCDQISDAILDAILEQDNDARVACECCCTENFLLIMGEITTNAKVNISQVAKDTIKKIGYDKEIYGFNYKSCRIKQLITKQSPDIALGVDKSMEHHHTDDDFDRIGAGDQGIMFGYACNETAEKMPLAIMLSHKLCKRLTEVRNNNLVSYLRPDGKAQVTVEYDKDHNIKRVDTVILSTQHDDDVDIEVLRKDMLELVIKQSIPQNLLDKDTKVYINPTGRFVVGGPKGDSGLTGRKIIVDTYGGYVEHGGGAFSGKDATKVDRSATYYARYVAKNLVASGICDKCHIQVAYSIGKATPVSVVINTRGTGKITDEKITKIVERVFDFRPQAIIYNLKLNKPQYLKAACYGHFGNSEYNWERIDKVDEIRKLY